MQGSSRGATPAALQNGAADGSADSDMPDALLPNAVSLDPDGVYREAVKALEAVSQSLQQARYCLISSLLSLFASPAVAPSATSVLKFTKTMY